MLYSLKIINFISDHNIKKLKIYIYEEIEMDCSVQFSYPM